MKQSLLVYFIKYDFKLWRNKKSFFDFIWGDHYSRAREFTAFKMLYIIMKFRKSKISNYSRFRYLNKHGEKDQRFGSFGEIEPSIFKSSIVLKKNVLILHGTCLPNSTTSIFFYMCSADEEHRSDVGGIDKPNLASFWHLWKNADWVIKSGGHQYCMFKIHIVCNRLVSYFPLTIQNIPVVLNEHWIAS